MESGTREGVEQLARRWFGTAGVPDGVLRVVGSRGPLLTVEHGSLRASDAVTLGSTSKAFTSVVMMQLAEDGVLDVDASPQRYLPGSDAPGEVSLLDLARHCSGLAPDATPSRPRRVRDRGFHYANQNYNLLGAVVSVVSGIPYETQLRRRVLEPLGMTGGRVPDQQDDVPAYTGAFGFNVPVRGFPVDGRSWIQPPSGALAMSAVDAGRFLSMFLAEGSVDGHRVLSAASVRRILQDVTPADGSPAVAGMLGDEGSYGLGWVRKRFLDQWVHMYTGKVPNSASMFVLLPETGLGVALLVNSGDFLVGTPMMEELAENVVRLLLGADPTRPPAPGTGMRRQRGPECRVRRIPDAVPAGLVRSCVAGWPRRGGVVAHPAPGRALDGGASPVADAVGLAVPFRPGPHLGPGAGVRWRDCLWCVSSPRGHPDHMTCHDRMPIG